MTMTTVMTRIIECDRCGEVTQWEVGSHPPKAYPAQVTATWSTGGAFVHSDMCNACARALIDWWNEGKQP